GGPRGGSRAECFVQHRLMGAGQPHPDQPTAEYPHRQWAAHPTNLAQETTIGKMEASNSVFESVYTTTAPLTYSRQSSHRDDWQIELGELLAFPTISAQPQHRRDIAAAAHWLKSHLARLGLHHVQ